MRESAVVLLVAVQDRVKDLLVPTDPLLEVFDPQFIAAPLLGVVCVALLEGNGEAPRDGSMSSFPLRIARAERGKTAGASATARKAVFESGGGMGKASVVSQAVASSMGDSMEGLKEASDIVRGV
jgi:hypothetical protein